MTGTKKTFLLRLSERLKGRIASDLIPETFNFVIGEMVNSELDNDIITILIKQFSNDLITVDCVIGKIIEAE